MEPIWMKIGEAARRLGVNPKELRYWEQIIPEIGPRRSQGNLRYYHVDELERLHQIKAWLAEGLTVADCRQLLLTGQLTRALDLGLGEEVEPRLRLKPRKPKAPKAPKASRKAPGQTAVARVAAALRKLLAQLDGTPGPEPPKLEAKPSTESI